MAYIKSPIFPTLMKNMWQRTAGTISDLLTSIFCAMHVAPVQAKRDRWTNNSTQMPGGQQNFVSNEKEQCRTCIENQLPVVSR